jgi:hypothetical protein
LRTGKIIELVGCALVAGVFLGPTLASGQELLGAPISAAGPANLPPIGTVLWQQQASEGSVNSVNVGWSQGWECLGGDNNPSNPANYPGIALVDETQDREIGKVIICEKDLHSSGPCYRPNSFTREPEWRGPIAGGDLISIVVVQNGQHCVGGSPWQLCSNGETCGGGMLFINALETP